MKKSFLYAAALFCFALLPMTAQEKKAEESVLKEWEQTLLFGIDTEVINVVKKLREYGETSLDGQLLEIFARSVNPALRKEILSYFTEKKYGAAEPAAYTLLANYEDEDPEVIRALISYLSEVKSLRSLELFMELVDAEQSLIAAGAIKAIGKLGDASRVAFLLEKLRDPELKEDRKPVIIQALGDLKSNESVQELLKIAGDRNEDHIWRMYACESLGKIGDARAVPVLQNIFRESDPLLKAYAANALANFDLGLVMDILKECLRDSYWKVRVAACSALARPGADKAVEALMYMVNKDPESVVKNEAIKALVAIGNPAGLAFLRQFILDQGKKTPLREYAAAVLIDKNLVAETLDALEKLIVLEWKNRDAVLLEAVCRKLMNTESGVLRKLYGIMLDHPSFVIRVNGVRGIAKNRYLDMRGRVEELSKKDSSEIVRKEAEMALGRF